MTIPTLTASHRKTEVTTKLKRIYSTVNQAINMSVAEYGEPASWWKDCGTSSASTCTTDEAIEWFNKYIGKNLKIIELQKTVNSLPGEEREGFLVYINDGSILYISNCLYDIMFYINTKAYDNPQYGINSFSFRFNPALSTGQNANDNKYTLKATFEPYANAWDGTRESLLSPTGFGCNKLNNNSAYCAKLIQYDGWEIKDDYPFKF